MAETSGTVIFFDLKGTLLQRTADAWKLSPGAAALIQHTSQRHRLGVLCNLGVGRTRHDVQRLLEAAGVYEQFDPQLIVVATDLPTPLPDRRAFAVAAALAEVSVERCMFVSADASLLLDAVAAG